MRIDTMGIADHDEMGPMTPAEAAARRAELAAEMAERMDAGRDPGPGDAPEPIRAVLARRHDGGALSIIGEPEEWSGVCAEGSVTYVEPLLGWGEYRSLWSVETEAGSVLYMVAIDPPVPTPEPAPARTPAQAGAIARGMVSAVPYLHGAALSGRSIREDDVLQDAVADLVQWYYSVDGTPSEAARILAHIARTEV